MKRLLLTALSGICCFTVVNAQDNGLRGYLDHSDETTYRVVATQSNGLVNPVDLDFHPDQSRQYELWVLNKGFRSTTLTIYDADTDNSSMDLVEDGNSFHFMARASSLAFGENGNWATAQAVQDANYNGGTFTGPSLWSSDMTIYGVIGNPASFDFNGSHLDMLHQSPYGMGIAHEVDNVYWVFDGWNEHIVRYDFVDDHGPGQHDHSDGRVTRYHEVSVSRDNSTGQLDKIVSSHMVIDKTTGWLYIVDTGNKRILRLDINSGENGSTLPFNMEPLAESREIDNVTWEVLVDSGLDLPSGIDVFNNQLAVTDFGTNEIIIYDIDDQGITEAGRISPPDAEGLQGIKIGPDGKLWYVDREARQVVHMQNPFVPTKEEVQNGNGIAGIDELVNPELRLYPNPTNGLVNLTITGNQQIRTVNVMNIMGELVHSESLTNQQQSMDLSQLATGVYTVEVTTDFGVVTEKLILRK